MGRRSTRENKNIYQLSREKMELTREQASDKLQYITPDRIEKIESEKVIPHPEEVLTMGECYEEPGLWNYYCTHECPIGQAYIPEVKKKDLSQITVEMLAALNALNKDKERFLEIAVDGKISKEEKEDFEEILERMEVISSTIDSLKLWIEKAMITGHFEN